jgi:hypothetical protein
MKYKHRKNRTDGPSAPEGRRTGSRRALLQLPRLARPEGCYAAYTAIGLCAGQTVRYYGPDGLGTSWDRTGRAPQHRILEGLDRAPHASGSRPRAGPTPSRSRGPDLVCRTWCYAIGTAASADPRGVFLPAHSCRVRSSATRPAGLRDPSGAQAALSSSQGYDTRVEMQTSRPRYIGSAR